MKNLFKEIPVIKSDRITMRRLYDRDAKGLAELAECEEVYRYEPTFLLEKNTGDPAELIDEMYGGDMGDSLFLGVFFGDEFCGLMELYGYREPIHKISIGYRLLPKSWGRGIATEALNSLVDYLYTKTNIEIITASSMVENTGSANVLRKCGFTLVAHAVEEDWGFDKPTITDKWIK